MSPSAKYSFWIDKLEETKRQERWSNTELEYIDRMIRFIEDHSEIFERDFVNDTSNAKFVAKFIRNWREYATSEIGWTGQYQYAMIADGGVFSDVITNLVNLPDSYFCSCSTKSDWCFKGKRCSDTHCYNEGGDGCGTLWLYNCNARCQKE